MALANRPRLLLADELTAGLEWRAALELIGDLDAALGLRHTAAIIVSHDARLHSHVDRSIVLRDGTIRESS